MTTTDSNTARRGRSPNYPGIDLGAAIERARTMYGQQRQFDANVASVLALWGFTPTSGAGGVVLAAMLRFGLVTDEGSGDKRRARLTPDALSIIRDEREVSPDRDKIIQRLALLPPIHREIWAEYGGELPPSDAALRFDLIQRRGFTESGADDFIREFRTTIAFAKLDSSAKIEEEAEEGDESEPDDKTGSLNRRGTPRKRELGMTVLNLQVSDRQVEIAVAGGPLTKAEIGLLKDYLAIQERIAPEQREMPPQDAANG